MPLNRVARVIAWQPKPESFFETANASNAIIIENLRVQFNCELTLKKQPNTCEITITNASEETRTFLQTKPVRARLEVGYTGELRQLFAGDLRWGQSAFVEKEWETKLQLADGDRAFRFAHVNKSFRSGTRLRDVLKYLASTLQVPIPRNLLTDPVLDQQYAGGLAVYGEAHHAITSVLRPLGYEWSIQNGRLQAIRETELAPGEAFRIDTATGMIGSPEAGAPDNPKKPPTVSVNTLVDPRIYPGSRVDLQSRAVKGTYKVVKVTHAGDNMGGDFQTSLELVAK